MKGLPISQFLSIVSVALLAIFVFYIYINFRKGPPEFIASCFANLRNKYKMNLSKSTEYLIVKALSPIFMISNGFFGMMVLGFLEDEAIFSSFALIYLFSLCALFLILVIVMKMDY